MKENRAMTAAAHLKIVPDAPSRLESLFEEHYDRVFRTACRVTGNINDAEDVLQTVFLRLARREGEIELKPNPQAYLLRAAINAGLDVIKARGAGQMIPIEEVTPQLLATTRNPEALHAGKEMKKKVRQELSRLSRRTAEMFVLKYFEGFDNQEIGRMLGTSHLVVGVMLHRARAQMRKSIEPVL